MSESTHKILIVTPVFNDWQSFRLLLDELHKTSNAASVVIEQVVAVNDGSRNVFIEESNSNNVTILNLNTNMGHQRAISIGLSYVEDNFKDVDSVIVMDSDGEDRPDDIESLVKASIKNEGQSIVFAKRKKRSEGFTFRFFYSIYKWMFYLLTTQKLNFGNYSCIPRGLLKRVVSIPEIWNHYSGGIIKSKISYVSVDTNRGNRYEGKSKMNFQNLLLHGLSSISIYLDVVSVRLILLAAISAIPVVLALLLIVYLGLFTEIPIPGWSSTSGLILINILAIVILTTFLVLLFQLNQKNTVKFPPRTFYKEFILSIKKY